MQAGTCADGALTDPWHAPHPCKSQDRRGVVWCCPGGLGSGEAAGKRRGAVASSALGPHGTENAPSWRSICRRGDVRTGLRPATNPWHASNPAQVAGPPRVVWWSRGGGARKCRQATGGGCLIGPRAADDMPGWRSIGRRGVCAGGALTRQTPGTPLGTGPHTPRKSQDRRGSPGVSGGARKPPASGGGVWLPHRSSHG